MANKIDMDNLSEEEKKIVEKQMKKIKGLNQLMILIVVCLVLMFAVVYGSRYFM